jgi:hypothetical protein
VNFRGQKTLKIEIENIEAKIKLFYKKLKEIRRKPSLKDTNKKIYWLDTLKQFTRDRNDKGKKVA